MSQPNLAALGYAPVRRAFNDPTVPCCGRDAANCDCGSEGVAERLRARSKELYDYAQADADSTGMFEVCVMAAARMSQMADVAEAAPEAWPLLESAAWELLDEYLGFPVPDESATSTQD